MQDELSAPEAEETERKPSTTEALELQAIERQQRRFGWISVAAIVVSFVHMATALALFSRETLIERGAALAMTALVDVATWAIANYVDYARRRQLTRSSWVKGLFAFALAISMGLNGAYLYAYRPAADVLPTWTSILIACAFALFVPMLIGVASLIRGELEDDRLCIQQAQARQMLYVATMPVQQQSANTMKHPTKSMVDGLAVDREREPAHSIDTRSCYRVNTFPTNQCPEPPSRTVPLSSTIATTDVAAIVVALRAAGVDRFQYASQIGEVCGWRSRSSAVKALQALRAAGAVHAYDDGGYVLVDDHHTLREPLQHALLGGAREQDQHGTPR
jgi:hypothetical protein